MAKLITQCKCFLIDILWGNQNFAFLGRLFKKNHLDTNIEVYCHNFMESNRSIIFNYWATWKISQSNEMRNSVDGKSFMENLTDNHEHWCVIIVKYIWDTLLLWEQYSMSRNLPSIFVPNRPSRVPPLFFFFFFFLSGIVFALIQRAPSSDGLWF